jgi:hypothetical protein
MPFDEASHHAMEVRILDEMLRILGQDGEYWIQDHERAGQRFCIVGALKHAEHLLRIYNCHGTHQLISATIERCHDTHASIIDFNDSRDRSFADIREVLLLAKCEALRRARIQQFRGDPAVP